jgi:hypothetical protein
VDESIERCPRDAERDASEAAAIELVAGAAIERSSLPAIGGSFTGERVARRNEQISYRIAIAAGAFEAHDLPDVMDRGLRFGKQHCSLDRLAVGAEARPALRIDQLRVATEPLGVPDAAGIRPGSAHEIPVLHRDRFSVRPAGTPGEDGLSAAEDFPCDGRLCVGRSHRAARTL